MNLIKLFNKNKVTISREEYERLIAIDSKVKARKEKSTKKQYKPKEYLYVGHYIDVDGNYILKVGTTNDLERRREEHCRKYPNAAKNPMADGEEFVYDWHIKLSKYNTLRYEDETKEKWKAENVGEYIKNDRFICKEKPTSVDIVIKKTYTVNL